MLASYVLHQECWGFRAFAELWPDEFRMVIPCWAIDSGSEAKAKLPMRMFSVLHESQHQQQLF